MNKRLPILCPGCSSALHVKTMKCNQCGTTIDGSFDLPLLATLSPEDQKFILSFIQSSGSLKHMAREMKLSYPTVRNILDEIIERITNKESQHIKEE
jgi:hypothetical protein